MFASRSRRVAGIEISSTALHGVVLERNDATGRILVRGSAIVPLSSGAPLEPALAKLLRRLPRAKRCAVTFWPEQAQLRIVKGPFSKPHVVQKMVEEDAAESLPLPLDAYQISVAPLSEDRSTSVPEENYGVGIIPTSEADAIAAMLKKFGRNLIVLQLTPFALANAFMAANPEIGPQEPFMLCHFMENRCALIAGNGGIPAAFRSIEIGNAVIEAILNQASDGSKKWDPIALQELPAEMAGALDAPMHALATEAMRCSDFMESYFGYWRAIRLSVSGRASNSRPAMGALATALGVPCANWNPLRECVALKRAIREEELTKGLSVLPPAAGVALQVLL